MGEVIDASVEEHFTVGGVDETDLDLRVERMRKLAPERNDLRGAAALTVSDADEQAEAVLRDTEQRLHLNPDRLARLLSVAVALAGGSLEREDELYRLTRVPAGWSRLVDDHLRIRRGSQQGALPRLVFATAGPGRQDP